MGLHMNEGKKLGHAKAKAGEVKEKVAVINTKGECEEMQKCYSGIIRTFTLCPWSPKLDLRASATTKMTKPNGQSGKSVRRNAAS